ncbi:MAG TPA: Fic family protein [Crocinitomicaceae bacterium]|nr:Fic family protein [Crocinitomicaceae bacterium]
MKKLNFISTELLEYYKQNQPLTLLKHFNKLKNVSQQVAGLNFYITISAVYSSQIEGSKLLVSDYMKINHSGMNVTNKDYVHVQDLITAYDYARKHVLNLDNLLKTHVFSTTNLIAEEKYRGQFRDKEVGIYDQQGQLVFQGCKAINVETEMNKLFADIKILRESDLTYDEIFYFASMLHLCFVAIHPFADGNGRTARLLEKWFLADKLGTDAWKIQSERLYQERITSYYSNLNLGKVYETVNYNASFPFLKMLPMALRLK